MCDISNDQKRRHHESVGSPTGSWLVTMVDPRPCRSCMISKRSRRCSAVMGASLQFVLINSTNAAAPREARPERRWKRCRNGPLGGSPHIDRNNDSICHQFDLRDRARRWIRFHQMVWHLGAVTVFTVGTMLSRSGVPHLRQDHHPINADI
jgi:hypothetical protein